MFKSTVIKDYRITVFISESEQKCRICFCSNINIIADKSGNPAPCIQKQSAGFSR